MESAAPEVENDAIDSRDDVDNKPKSAQFWLGEIAAAKKREDSWRRRGNRVIARYRDERDDERANTKAERRASILWSNTEILKSALFQGVSKPDVRRRYAKSKGKDDRASRTAALVLERALAATAECADEDAQIEAAVEDMLLPGRGVAWIVYDAEISKVNADDGGREDQVEAGSENVGANGLLLEQGEDAPADPEDEAPEEEITSQTVRIDHVYWEDYLCSAGRKDSDCWWKARGHDYSRDELKKYWPDHAANIPLEVQVAGFEPTRKGSREEDTDTFKRARVWEIWDKSKKQRVYIAEGYKIVLEEKDDPYGLTHFFPTVRPLIAVGNTSTLSPIPEYCQYQDQAEELDLITTRISRLINNLKRRGVYDASADGPDQQLSQLAFAGDDVFLPYRNFPVLMEKGGLKNVFQTEDLIPTITVLDKLYQQRAALVQTIYEVTGISDVIRGASNPNETATAQRIKGQFGSLRLQSRQKLVQGFIRDLYRLKAEVIAEHFTREQLQEMSGIDMPTKAEQLQAKQTIAAIQQQVQMAQQSQQQMQAYQQQMQAAQQQGAPGAAGPGAGQMPPMHGQPPPQAAPGALPNQMPPQGQMGPMGAPQPSQIAPSMMGPPPQPVPMPQIDPEMMQDLFATATAVAWEDVAAIMRNDKLRSYKIDVETENTAQIDSDTEKQQRIEFLATMQGFMERVVPTIMQAPALAPLAKELVMFGVGGFKVGRTLDESFSDTFDQLQQMAQQAQQAGPQVDPATQAKVEQTKAATQKTIVETQSLMQTSGAEAQAAQADLIARQSEAQASIIQSQQQAQDSAMEREAKAQEQAADFGIRMQEQKREDVRLSHEIEMDRHSASIDQFKAKVEQQKMHLERQEAAEDLQAMREDRHFQRQSQMQERQQSAEAHQLDMGTRVADHRATEQERQDNRQERRLNQQFQVAERSQKMAHADRSMRHKDRAALNADAKAKRDAQRPSSPPRRPI
jgi:hypothetical protein